MVISFLCLAAGFLAADDPSKTILNLEILAPRGQLGLESQQWARIFEDIGVPVRIRTKFPTDEVDITERSRGTLRIVTAVGELNRDGSVTFPKDRKFTLRQRPELARWIEGLKVYGAAGRPEDEEGWGLTRQGLMALEVAFAQQALVPETPTAANVIQALGTVTAIPVRVEPDARDYLVDSCQWPGGPLAVGTSTAIALESVGLGFKPRRLPTGATEIVVVVKVDDSVWPPGWVIPRGVSPGKFVPGLFAMTEMPIDDVTIVDFIKTMAASTGERLVPLRGELDAQAPDWQSTVVPASFRPIQPILPLTRVLRKVRLTREYRLDDARAPFVLIRVQDPRRQAVNPVTPPPAVAETLDLMLPKD